MIDSSCISFLPVQTKIKQLAIAGDSTVKSEARGKPTTCSPTSTFFVLVDMAPESKIPFAIGMVYVWPVHFWFVTLKAGATYTSFQGQENCPPVDKDIGI